jgi:hypothetical protein
VETESLGTTRLGNVTSRRYVYGKSFFLQLTNLCAYDSEFFAFLSTQLRSLKVEVMPAVNVWKTVQINMPQMKVSRALIGSLQSLRLLVHRGRIGGDVEL